MRQRERGEVGRGREERDGWTERQRQRPRERTDSAAQGARAESMQRHRDKLRDCKAQS